MNRLTSFNLHPFIPSIRAHHSMDDNEKLLHIAMLPWAAFGHLIPFLNLAKLLAQKGHSISFISTPKNILRLSKISPNLTTQIRFVEFLLPSTCGLPPEAEATSDISHSQSQYLKDAYDGLQPQVAAFLQSSLPNWLIVDFTTYWAPPMASTLNIRTAFFCIFKASTLAFMGPFASLDSDQDEYDTRKSVEDWTVKPKWVPFESSMAFRYFEAARMTDYSREQVSGVTAAQRLSATMRSCDLIAPKTSYEFEPEWLRLLEDICRKPVLPVGHLPQSSDEDASLAWQPVKEWLDRWPQGSVIYVAFGSESALSQQELAELALGLEKSKFPFFWALKNQESELPEGFKGRVEDRGVVWRSWAPQLRILAHGSVGGFLSHSGWSSVVESIVLRKPLILLPLFSDQGLVARVLEEKGLGYAIPRDERDGSFTRDSVADSVTMVVAGEEGKVYRENVKEMSVHLGDMDGQAKYVDEFAKYLQSHTHKAS